MPWLYEHREQLDEELARFVEIAHHFTGKVLPHDRDDVEQEIVITVKGVADSRSDVGEGYLKRVARNVVKDYWLRRYRHKRRFIYLNEGSRGEMVAKTNAFVSGRSRDEKWTLFSNGGDKDARLDAIATLATLPQRLVEIGYMRLNGGDSQSGGAILLDGAQGKAGLPETWQGALRLGEKTNSPALP